jgi:hypothetical protein
MNDLMNTINQNLKIIWYTFRINLTLCSLWALELSSGFNRPFRWDAHRFHQIYQQPRRWEHYTPETFQRCISKLNEVTFPWHQKNISPFLLSPPPFSFLNILIQAPISYILLLISSFDLLHYFFETLSSI